MGNIAHSDSQPPTEAELEMYYSLPQKKRRQGFRKRLQRLAVALPRLRERLDDYGRLKTLWEVAVALLRVLLLLAALFGPLPPDLPPLSAPARPTDRRVPSG